MADDRPQVVNDHDRDDARHAAPFGPRGGQAMDLVVGDRDGLANPGRDRPRLAFQPRSERAQCDVGGFSTRSVTAHAIDDDEQPARGVDVQPVLVDCSLQSRVRLARRLEHGG